MSRLRLRPHQVTQRVRRVLHHASPVLRLVVHDQIPAKFNFRLSFVFPKGVYPPRRNGYHYTVAEMKGHASIRVARNLEIAKVANFSCELLHVGHTNHGSDRPSLIEDAERTKPRVICRLPSMARAAQKLTLAQFRLQDKRSASEIWGDRKPFGARVFVVEIEWYRDLAAVSALILQNATSPPQSPTVPCHHR